MSRRIRSKTRSSMHNRRSAFTLLEVLLVLAILVVVGSLAVTQFMNIFDTSKIDTTKTAITSAKDTIKMFQIQHGKLPISLEELVTGPSDLPDANRWKPYYEKAPVDAWGQTLNYELNEGTIHIWSSGPNGTPNDGDDVEVK